jgi:ribose/xylose/arabinose/galactoside ABC-type transport system permease subunit
MITLETSKILKENIVVIVLLLLIFTMTAITGSFFSLQNFKNLLIQISIY